MAFNPHWASEVNYGPITLVESRSESQQWEHYRFVLINYK